MAEESTKGGIPGKVVREVIVPAREYLSLEVKKGQVLRLIDIEGQQVIDLFAFNLNDLQERSSAWATRGINEKWRIMEGHSIFSQRCNKMYTIIDDKVGKNVLDGGFCTEEINYARYGIKGTRNCRDNFIMAVAPYGLTTKDIQEDGNATFFMNLAPAPDGAYVIGEPIKQPGRYIDLLADVDLLVAISNCPQEHNPCNAFHPTPVKIVVYETC